MLWEPLEFTQGDLVWLLGSAGVVVLLALLVTSFASRPRVFCQYLSLMTGIELKPSTVIRVYKAKGRGGVRDHLINLLIQQDLADPDRVVTPDSKPDTSMFDEAP